jgi:hypothetical protein
VDGDGEVFFMQVEEVAAYEGFDFFEFGILRGARGAVGVAPEAHEGCDGDVEGASGFLMEGFGEGEAVPGGQGDAAALSGFEVAEAPDFAGGAEAAEFFFEALDFEADGVGDLSGVSGVDVGLGDDHGEGGGHGVEVVGVMGVCRHGGDAGPGLTEAGGPCRVLGVGNGGPMRGAGGGGGSGRGAGLGFGGGRPWRLAMRWSQRSCLTSMMRGTPGRRPWRPVS